MNKSKVITGVLIAVAAGAVIGGLFATKKGKKFRKMVAKKSGEYSEKAMNKFTKLKERGEELAEKGKKEASKMHDPKFAM